MLVASAVACWSPSIFVNALGSMSVPCRLWIVALPKYCMVNVSCEFGFPGPTSVRVLDVPQIEFITWNLSPDDVIKKFIVLVSVFCVPVWSV